MAVTDSYHHVYFTLEDGSRIGYSFEGEDIILIPSGAEAGSSGSAAEPHPVEGSRGLWELYRELTEE